MSAGQPESAEHHEMPSDSPDIRENNGAMRRLAPRHYGPELHEWLHRAEEIVTSAPTLRGRRAGNRGGARRQQRRRPAPGGLRWCLTPHLSGHGRFTLSWLSWVWRGWVSTSRNADGSNHRRSAPPKNQVTDFWTALIEAWQADPIVRLREARVDPLPTIAWDGAVTLVSPELAGFHSERHGDFSYGNVLRTPLDQLIRTGMRAEWVREYQCGIAQCRLSCLYFAFCGGGHPLNRYFEHGRDGRHRNRLLSQQQDRAHDGAIRLARRDKRKTFR